MSRKHPSGSPKTRPSHYVSVRGEVFDKLKAYIDETTPKHERHGEMCRLVSDIIDDALDAQEAAPVKCGGCRQPATRRDADDVADVCDYCGEASDRQRAERMRHEKRLAAMEVI